MRKMKYFKCPECGMKFTALNGWAKHIKRDHPGLKPKEMTDMQYLYYTITGKTHGNCIQCHGETSWNETNGKYNRFCNNPNCKAEYTKMAKQRMVDKYGKQHLLNDPDMQRKMLKGKHISGTYKFSNNSGSVDYVGTYEKDFLYIMDHVMGFSAGDIMGPSPHNYIYSYEGKARVYIPDFYIPNYNLEIEIKTDENMHHKIQAVDKVKEHLKDEMMSHNPSVNYFKVLDKKYDDFFKYLLDKKFDIDEMAMENVNKYLETGAKESALESSSNKSSGTEEAIQNTKNDFQSIQTPEELSKWMKRNIEYNHDNSTWKLRSYDQVLSEKKGDCHDQSEFESKWFNDHGIVCFRLFMIEFDSTKGKWYQQQCGSTHTVVVYTEHGKLYWFENAWGNEAGIHGPYNSIESVADAICKAWTHSDKYDTLYFAKVSNVKPGMNLEKYVLANVPNRASKSFYKKI